MAEGITDTQVNDEQSLFMLCYTHETISTLPCSHIHDEFVLSTQFDNTLLHKSAHQHAGFDSH